MARYSGWITDQRRHALYIRDDYRCCYCGTVLGAESDQLSLDHLKTWSSMERAGGKLDHSNSNVVTCCLSCNSSRGERDLLDFAPGGALARIAAQRVKPIDLRAGQKAHAAARRRRGYAVK